MAAVYQFMQVLTTEGPAYVRRLFGLIRKELDPVPRENKLNRGPFSNSSLRHIGKLQHRREYIKCGDLKIMRKKEIFF